MEQAEIDFQANEAEIAWRPQRLRWVLWAAVLFCAVMICLVVLSQTRIAARAQSDLSDLSGLISVPHASAGLTAAFARAVASADGTPPEAAPQAMAKRALVNAMPTSRMPVRRAGISVGD